MSTPEQPPSEEELRAVYEEEIRKIRVDQILLEQVVSLVNLGMRRTGLAPGTEGERDVAQVRLAIEAIRALLPLLEQTAPEHIKAIRDALSQLQMAFIRIGGATAAPAQGEAPEPSPDRGPAGGPSATQPPGAEAPAQRSSRLWIPGQ